MSAERVGFFHPARGYVRVKTGFSWPAFFFGSLWACAKGLWLPMLAMFAMDGLIWLSSGFAQAHRDTTLALSGFVVQIVYWVMRGRWGNSLWRTQLLRQGWRRTRGQSTLPT